MTVSVGNLGAEIETGERGLGQTSFQPVNKSGANCLAPSGSNLATAAPSFRSSWQTVFDGGRGVSRGTNTINNLQEETGRNTETTGTEAVLTPNKLQTASLPILIASSQSTQSQAQTNATSATQIATSRLQQKSEQDATDLLETTAAPDPKGLLAANRPRRTESRCAQQNTSAQSAKASSQVLTSPTIEAAWLPIPAVSATATVASIVQTQIPMGASAPSEAGEMPPGSESDSALPGLRSTQVLTAAEFAPQEAGAMHTGRANSGAQNLPIDSISLAGGAARAITARNTSSASLDELSEASAVHAGLHGESSASAAQHESKAAGIGNSTGHTGSLAGPGNLAHSEISLGGTGTVALSASSSGSEKTSADAPQTILPGHSAQGVQGHTAPREASTAAAPAVAEQPATLDVTNAALRTPAALHSAQPSGGATQTASAASPASAQDTFGALDRETSMGVPTWTHAAGQHAEAGFRDPDLGWVGVRADLSSSGIHATLVPSSSDAAQTLGSHLAGLSSHLADEHAPVASLSMASPGESGADGGVGQRMQQGTDGDAPGNRPDESSANPQKNATAESSMSALAATAESTFSSQTDAYQGDLRGTHISVIA